jgi:RNA polymerase sigma-70 factor (ECF subfamily)
MYTEGNSKSFFSRQALKIRKNILIYQVLKKGDHNAFGQLYDLYVSQIFRFIFFKVLRREEAEDLTAETFLKMWEYLVAQGAKKREIGNFQALLYRIARNAVIDFYRKKNTELKNIEPLALEQISSEVAAAPLYDLKEVGELGTCLIKLKDLYREVLILKYIDGRSVGEIAEITGKSKGHVRVILHRGLQTLREMIKEAEGRPAKNHELQSSPLTYDQRGSYPPS